MRVLAHEQVEKAGPHNDGHARALDGKPDAARGQLVHDAGARGQSEGASAREDDGVHGLDHVLGLEQVRLAGGRTAAAHGDAADGPLGRDGDRASRCGAQVVGVPAAEGGQVGERGGLEHGASFLGGDSSVHCTPLPFSSRSRSGRRASEDEGCRARARRSGASRDLAASPGRRRGRPHVALFAACPGKDEPMSACGAATGVVQ